MGKFAQERSFQDFAETETLEKLETFSPEESFFPEIRCMIDKAEILDDRVSKIFRISVRNMKLRRALHIMY